MRPSVRPLIVYSPTQCRIAGDQLYQTLNPGQKDACDSILTAVRSGRGGLFFIDGPGGSGKTYLYITLFNMLVGSGKKVVCTAWAGIAATLLPAGRTAASLFKLNIQDNCKSSSLKRQHKDARELAETDVFIWDEASMIPKNALQTVEETLRDMTGVSRLFGGAVFILGGDFRQVLPVVKRGSRGDAIEACIKSSRLWSTFTQLTLQTNMRATTGDAAWTDFLLGVGNGTANDKDFDDKVQLPQEVMGSGNIVKEVFGASIRAADIDSLAEMAILAPRNCDVNVLNDEVLRRMEGDERKYYSADEAVCEDPTDITNYPTEMLNQLNPSSLPPSVLRLKKGAVVMLLRNLDVTSGLCNGTRLIIHEFHPRNLICKFACGDRKGQPVIIPRIDCYCEEGLPFKLRRRQFPVELSFAMSIHKAQGQSFDRIGLWLPTDVFTHGQLYVALSRVRSREGLTVQAAGRFVTNVVFDEVLE